MSLLRRVDLMEPFCAPPLFFTEPSSIVGPRPLAFPSFFEDPDDVTFALDLLTPRPRPFELLDHVADLIQLERAAPFSSLYRRIHRRIGAECYLETLSDRVSALETSFDRLAIPGFLGNGKYTWTEEIEGKHFGRKYKWTTEIKEGKEKKKHHHLHHKDGKSYKWTAEIKEKGLEGPITRTYTWKSTTGDGCKSPKDKKKEKKTGECATRLVEIEEHDPHGAVVLRQAFAKRAGVIKKAKGKVKELSPQDAAALIQMNFRAHLIRRSQALRALRDLAVAKAKVKEIRALFHNFSYRRCMTHDTEERQRFTEKIIVVLLTIDAIEGVDFMVRASKKSMMAELEDMLDVVDPQPLGKSLYARRRTLDVPDGLVKEEFAEGVAKIVRMLDQEENSTSSTSEA